MKIFITEEYLVGSIQDEFHFRYPHLKLEFFRNPHGIFEGSPRKEKFPRDTAIDDIRNIHSAAWIDIGEFVTAAELEQQFAHLLGLSVQVLRKSGSIWLETTANDGLTLGELEAMGREPPASNEIPEIDLNEQS